MGVWSIVFIVGIVLFVIAVLIIPWQCTSSLIAVTNCPVKLSPLESVLAFPMLIAGLGCMFFGGRGMLWDWQDRRDERARADRIRKDAYYAEKGRREAK